VRARAGTFGAVADPVALIDAAIAAAFAAGREILAVYGTDLAAEQKADKSPLTEADRRAHRAIVGALAVTGLPVLSEEGRQLDVTERQPWDNFWLVDPLDGTKEFIKRNGEFTVNIALMRRDKEPASALGTSAPVGAVLYVPVKDVLYFSWQGGGAYRIERARTRGTSAAAELAPLAQRLPLALARDTYTIVASRSHSSPDTETFIKRMQEKHGRVDLVSMGSALKICLVAEGAADVYPRYAPTMEWDTAAGHAIAIEAGKQLIDITTNQPMRYNKASLVNNWFIVQ
jgi:3'(2'), 5'-bisphosphate nucleotidase